MKYDLGCGYKAQDGFVRVDHDARTVPDICHNLEVFPWPIPDESAEEIRMIHVLEHLCPLPEDYKRLWQEMYRICVPAAKIHIEVPHWRHNNFHHDPTHVRAITPVTLAMMDQTRNGRDIANHGGETPLGLQWEVDFELVGVGYANDQTTGEPMCCMYELVARKPCPVTAKG